MKRIYDGFTFFNELDLLELRLEELYDHVDYFILVESDHTFTNIPKPYYFDENKERYAKFLDKIIHLKINSNKNVDPWQNEFHQRNCIIQGCNDAQDDDLLIISDVDEISRPEVIDSIRQTNKDIYALYTPFFYFKFNYVSTRADCYLPIIVSSKVSIAKRHGIQMLRGSRDSYTVAPFKFENYDCEVFEHAGWHFGYLGDTEFVKRKFVSFSHAMEMTKEHVENYSMESELFSNSTERFFVKVDDYFPKTLLRNLDKYHQYLVNGDYPSIRELIEKGLYFCRK